MAVPSDAAGSENPPVACAAAATGQRRRRGEALAGWSLAGPALVLLVALFFLPVVAVFAIALTDWQFGAGTMSFVGIENFRQIFSDAAFRASFVNTVLYAMIVVPGSIVLGLSIALLIEAGRSMRAFYRAVHFLPFMATLTAMAIAWEALLHPTIGLVNQTLSGLGLPVANWLRDDTTVLPTLAAIGIWQNLGYAMVLFLAGLKAIPQELYDAADIDGADAFPDRLRTVTLPMLGPVTMFVFIVVALRAFETFDTVQILTQGGPGHASEMLLFSLYRESFQYLRTGYGASIAVVFLIIVVILTLAQARLMDRKVHYQ
ncbi:carbohydrate ABC transporter permease [Rhizobium rhizogenes]|uniref:carbohydrate ABC transporter permease n=1 Tax=Rhizobium rhizogenes TaxID=359 RepID=UPI003866B050